MSDEPEQSEKTEDASQKKLDDAIERGDVAKSQEVNTWFVMVGVTFVVLVMADGMMRTLVTPMENLLGGAHGITVDGPSLIRLTGDLGREVMLAMAGPLLLLAGMAIAGNLIQHRFVMSAKSLAPKLSKISPLAGAKRLFSKESLANFLKGLIKLAVVSGAMGMLLWPRRDRLDALVSLDMAALLPMLRGEMAVLLGAVLAALSVIAALDFVYQRRRWYERQKMTLREVKDEYKQMEGDPAIKAKIRQIRAERGRRRMMSSVPNASVVIMNPTHFAVALKYQKGMNAPLCLAKGVDGLALKIRAAAEENDVPVVENAPLARALYASAEIDREINPEHYKAVAEVIGYVMRLKERARWRT